MRRQLIHTLLTATIAVALGLFTVAVGADELSAQPSSQPAGKGKGKAGKGKGKDKADKGKGKGKGKDKANKGKGKGKAKKDEKMAEKDERKAEKMEEKAEKMEEKAEKMEEKAEKMEEKAEEMEEAAEEKEEEAEEMADEGDGGDKKNLAMKLEKEQKKHIRRIAQIARLEEIGKDKKKDTLVEKAGMLRDKENKRHDKVMKRLGAPSSDKH